MFLTPTISLRGKASWAEASTDLQHREQMQYVGAAVHGAVRRNQSLSSFQVHCFWQWKTYRMQLRTAANGVMPIPPATHILTRYLSTSSIGLPNGPSMYNLQGKREICGVRECCLGGCESEGLEKPHVFSGRVKIMHFLAKFWDGELT